MAGIKISALPAVLAAQLTDFFPVVQGAVTSRETVGQLVTLLNTPGTLTGYVPTAGGTMTGPLILSGDPILPLGAATKQYVDLFASGITVILSCAAATTANLTATQAGAGVGATLTNSGAMAALVIDGYATVLNDRILVKNQTLPQHNGIYTVTNVGSGATNWILTRATDYDTPAEIVPGTLVAVNNGTVNAMTSWLETATVVTVDTDPVLFSQFTFAPSAFLLKANNLSDLASIPTALINLGLGTPTGTYPGNVVMQTSPTLITPNLGIATATSLQFSPTNNGIIGTNTNDNAMTGRVGEYINSNVSVASGGVALTNAIAINVTSIALTAGDWDVSGNVYATGSISNINQFFCWINTVSAAIPADGSILAAIYPTSSSLSPQAGLAAPIRRINIAGPTTVFLETFVGFASGSVVAYGNLSARRVR